MADLASVTSEWIKLTAKHCPPPRYRHSAVVYHNGLYIVGGVNANNEAHDDVWHYEFERNRWKLIKKLKLHFICYLMAVTCGKARLFGSGMFGQGNAPNLTYIYDCDSLSERTPKISIVGNFEVNSLREGSIQRYKEELFLLTEDTLYEFNKDNHLVFVKLPIALKGAALVNIDDHMFVIGGQLPNKEMSKDIFIYSIHSKKFSKLTQEASELPNLYNHRAVASLGNIFLFGGVRSDGDELVQFNDIYQFSDSFKLSPVPDMSELSAWHLLPNDILHHVFSFMEGEHLARSQTISRNIYHLLNRPYFKTQMKKCQFLIVGSDELKRKRFFVVLIGPSKSGKTSVVRRLVDKAYQGYVDVDLVWYQRDIKHEYGETSVDIYVPFSRQSLTATFAGLNYHNAEVGILLVCDVGDKKSLLHIRAQLEELNSRHQNKVPTIILANKADLAEHVRQVSDQDLQNLSDKFHIPFMETSAKNNINIELAFQLVAQQVFIHAAQKAIAQQNQRCDVLQHKRCK